MTAHSKRSACGFKSKEPVTMHPTASTYRELLALKDKHVFSIAARTLDAGSVTEVGNEMRTRRRENPGRPGSRCAQRRQKL